MGHFQSPYWLMLKCVRPTSPGLDTPAYWTFHLDASPASQIQLVEIDHIVFFSSWVPSQGDVGPTIYLVIQVRNLISNIFYILLLSSSLLSYHCYQQPLSL